MNTQNNRPRTLIERFTMNTTQQPLLTAYDHRPGTGPTLVFLHYWGGSARTWDLVVDRLAGRDMLTVDFRGWSRSSNLAGPYTLRQLADDTLAVIADAGVTDYVLVGHSMGGKVAQLIAATRPVALRGSSSSVPVRRSPPQGSLPSTGKAFPTPTTPTSPSPAHGITSSPRPSCLNRSSRRSRPTRGPAPTPPARSGRCAASRRTSASTPA